MFRKGDTIVYATTGVCVIDDIREQACTGEVHTYYVLQPVFDSSSKVFAPVGASEQKMRAVLTAGEADELVRALPTRRRLDRQRHPPQGDLLRYAALGQPRRAGAVGQNAAPAPAGVAAVRAQIPSGRRTYAARRGTRFVRGAGLRAVHPAGERGRLPAHARANDRSRLTNAAPTENVQKNLKKDLILSRGWCIIAPVVRSYGRNRPEA